MSELLTEFLSMVKENGFFMIALIIVCYKGYQLLKAYLEKKSEIEKQEYDARIKREQEEYERRVEQEKQEYERRIKLEDEARQRDIERDKKLEEALTQVTSTNAELVLSNSEVTKTNALLVADLGSMKTDIKDIKEAVLKTTPDK